VIVDITEYRRLTGSGQGLAQIILGGPRLGDDEIAVLNEIEAERRADLDLRTR